MTDIHSVKAFTQNSFSPSGAHMCRSKNRVNVGQPQTHSRLLIRRTLSVFSEKSLRAVITYFLVFIYNHQKIYCLLIHHIQHIPGTKGIHLLSEIFYNIDNRRLFIRVKNSDLESIWTCGLCCLVFSENCLLLTVFLLFPHNSTESADTFSCCCSILSNKNVSLNQCYKTTLRITLKHYRTPFFSRCVKPPDI